GQVLAKLDAPQLKRKLTMDQAHMARLQHEAVVNSSSGKIASLQAREASLRAKVQSLSTQMNLEERKMRSLSQLVAQNAANGGDLAKLRAKHARTHAKHDQAQAQLGSVQTRLSKIKQS